MKTTDNREIAQKIYDRGRIHTPFSGAVRMPDGVDYYGNVWKVDGKLYVFYKNEPHAVCWEHDAYRLV